jgi:hypothetical protein
MTDTNTSTTGPATSTSSPSTPAQARPYQQLRAHLAALKLHTAAEALPRYSTPPHRRSCR